MRIVVRVLQQSSGVSEGSPHMLMKKIPKGINGPSPKCAHKNIESSIALFLLMNTTTGKHSEIHMPPLVCVITSVRLVLLFVSSCWNFADNGRTHSRHSAGDSTHASFHQPDAHARHRSYGGGGILGEVQALSSYPSHTAVCGSNSSPGDPIQTPRESAQHARLCLWVVLVVV